MSGSLKRGRFIVVTILAVLLVATVVLPVVYWPKEGTTQVSLFPGNYIIVSDIPGADVEVASEDFLQLISETDTIFVSRGGWKELTLMVKPKNISYQYRHSVSSVGFAQKVGIPTAVNGHTVTVPVKRDYGLAGAVNVGFPTLAVIVLLLLLNSATSIFRRGR